MKLGMKKTAMLAIIICAALGAARVFAADNAVSARVVTFGLIETKSTQKVDDPSTPSGTSVNATGLKVVKETILIPAEAGTIFGYEYLIVGLPFNQTVELREVYAYPEMTLPDGRKSTGYERVVKKRTDSFGIFNGIQGYVVEHPYEQVPGDWKMELWYKGDKLAEKEFSLVAGNAEAENAGKND